MRSFAAFLLPVLVAAAPALDLGGPGGPGIGPDGAGDKPDPSQIQIVSSSWSGNGCPPNSVTTTTSVDKTVVTFGFTEFQTFIGPGFNPKEKNKNCQLHLQLKYPTGFQFAVLDSTYHGWAELDKGVTGTFSSQYYFSQSADQTTTTTTRIEGGGVWEMGQPYTKTDAIPTTAYIYSPCGANGILNINNRIALQSNNASARGLITNDDATIALTQQVHLNWRPCK